MVQAKTEEFRGERNAGLIDNLTAVWDNSVRTTHHFLAEQDISALIPQVKTALQGIGHLVIAWEGAEPVGFMGIQEHKIEMLFLAPSSIGKGLGREMIKLAIDRYGRNTWTSTNRTDRPKASTGTWDSARSAATRPTDRAILLRYSTCGGRRSSISSRFLPYKKAA